MGTHQRSTLTSSPQETATDRVAAAALTELQMLSSWLWPLGRGLEWLLRVGARPSAKTILEMRAAEDETRSAIVTGREFRFRADEMTD